MVNPPSPPLFFCYSLPYSQRWFPLSPPTLRAEDPLLGGEGWAGVGGAAGVAVGGGVGLHANATEQRRAADFAHYNPIIQVSRFSHDAVGLSPYRPHSLLWEPSPSRARSESSRKNCSGADLREALRSCRGTLHLGRPHRCETTTLRSFWCA